MALLGQNSIANELLQTILDAKFTQVLCLLNPEFAITINHFKRIKDIAHNNYWINTQKCITKSGKPIASGIFDNFGRFESCLACETRDEMIEWALEHKEELGETARIALRQLDVSLMYWINRMQKETTLADELALYCLSKVYNRHVKVYTSSYCWTNLQDQFTLTQEEIGNLCDVHLLYMGPGKFAEIKRIRPPTPHTPGLPAHLPSPIVIPSSSVTPSKGKRG